MNAIKKQYEPATIQKAEFIAKIFSDLPQEKSEQVLELANTYLDGINVGIRLASNSKETAETTLR